MNVFRLTGDLSHLAAILILLLKIYSSRSCRGLSGKTQIMFALVFTTRYLDLFVYYVSLYNTVMKLVFVLLSYMTVYFMYFKFKASLETGDHLFRLPYFIVPIGGLAVLVNHKPEILEILWTFSIYLEAVAILPQLFMISSTGQAETITAHYLFALGSYRALYLVNWIYRYYTEDVYDLIAIVAGCVQTLLYIDFFYLYITKVLKGKSLVLPV
ncbi:ER lumen protein-retaining receptor [Fasciola hepatica]|uniref:ER lumen protein-retaining receptor n=1 Tax=Fasciola hepatica TaxID=6192 RepID=A0A4E0RCV7_FASHE|nr:ER lumen protein-retaining receptor [Fasciola hepatica]